MAIKQPKPKRPDNDVDYVNAVLRVVQNVYHRLKYALLHRLPA